ncbi:Biofilm PGA outer membrane secretin PgaA [hydrothermal vent metagenome]|uniref:Biofilm PGA outer membrane secretin PgaA n=1 Tax=hydrothermal vent metagenome TaxID=652676 RepID=A0A3B1CTF1_9ZZZZ
MYCHPMKLSLTHPIFSHVKFLLSGPAMVLILSLCGIFPALAAPEVDPLSNPGATHRAAIAQARQGEHEAALKRLASLLEAYPKKWVFRYDYISVLAWAGRDKAVLAQAAQINFKRAPAYALKDIGKSARNLQQTKLAIKAYRTVLKRNPDDRQAHLGLAMSLAEAKKAAEADAQMAALLKIAPMSVTFLEALAYVKETDRNYAAAINAYDRLLEIAPTHSGARRGRIMALLHLGVPHEAIRLARRDTEAFSVKDWKRMAGDLAALEIRWGRLPTVKRAERYRDTDAAIETLKKQYDQMADKSITVTLRNRFNLILAYRNRRYLHEATALYEQLREQGLTRFPPYVLAAVGDAYLSLHQPQRAVDLLEQAIKEYPGDLDAQYSLYYAYLESGQYEKSLAHIDSLNASLPQWTHPPGNQQRHLNLNKLYAQTIAAMARAYVGQLDVAERRLSTQLAQVPANTDVRNALGRVYLWRGWPRLALGEFRTVLALEPENLSARMGIVSVLDSRGGHAASDAALAPLQADYPEDSHVRNLSLDAEVRKMREIWMSLRGGSSSNSIYQGSKDLTFKAYYYDQPWRPGLRPFVSLIRSSANFIEQAVSRNRVAAGMDYQLQDMRFRGSISDGDGSTGISLRGDWMPSDYWRGGLFFESFSEQTPLRADLSAVEAWSIEANTAYHFNESRRLGLSLQYMGFDDDNQRKTFSVFARQRLIKKLRYTLNGEIYYYRQSNTIAGTAYFNPSRQNAFSLTFNNAWLSYQHYEKSMRQVLILSAGPNSQQGFDSKFTWSLGYEHYWRFSRQFSLSYGISRARYVYDGVPEFSTRGFLTLYTRF